MRVLSRLRGALLAGLALGMSLAGVNGAGWTELQITNNEAADISPQVSGSRVVWQGEDPNEFESDWEIFLDDGITTVQLTQNAKDDINPDISGNTVVWQGQDPNDTENDWEIFLYDGEKITQITENATDDINPKIYESFVVWQGWDGSDWEIFVHHRGVTAQITNNDYDDISPQVSESTIVWQGGDGQDWEIFSAGLPVSVAIKIAPHSINMDSNGKWISCLVGLPEDMNAAEVDASSLRLQGTVAPATVKQSGNAERLLLKFDRAAVQQTLESGNNVEVVLTGTMKDGRMFEGTDSIKALSKKPKEHGPKK
jgi:hypothetical protein